MRNPLVRLATLSATVMLVLVTPPPALSQVAEPSPVLDLATAEELATAARRHARERGWTVVIAIVDAGGHLILLQRMENAQLGSIEVAREKARSAILFQRPTREIQEWVEGGNLAVLNLTGAIPLAGGRPIRVAGTLLGAIGISGMTAAQDDEIAGAALDRVRDTPSSDAGHL